MGQLEDRASNQFAQSLSDTAGKLAYQNYGKNEGCKKMQFKILVRYQIKDYRPNLQQRRV